MQKMCKVETAFDEILLWPSFIHAEIVWKVCLDIKFNVSTLIFDKLQSLV